MNTFTFDVADDISASSPFTMFALPEISTPRTPKYLHISFLEYGDFSPTPAVNVSTSIPPIATAHFAIYSAIE